MSILIHLLFGLSALVLETFIRAAFGLDLWSPPLFTIFVLWIAVSQIGLEGLFLITGLGFLADGLSGGPAGAQGLTALVLVLLLPLLAIRYPRRRNDHIASSGASTTSSDEQYFVCGRC